MVVLKSFAEPRHITVECPCGTVLAVELLLVPRQHSRSISWDVTVVNVNEM